MKCAICGKEITDYGNNPFPVRTDENTRCCDECNTNYVVPFRIILLGTNDMERQMSIAEKLNEKNTTELDHILHILGR